MFHSPLSARAAYWWGRFRPQPGLTLAMLAMVVILLGLGGWQVARLQQKNAILADLRAQMRGAPVDLRRDWPASDAVWRQLAHRPVVAQGEWLDQQRLHLAPRTLDGQTGSQLVVPFRARDRIILVNRGFVRDGAATLPAPGGLVTLHGVVRLPETGKASRFTPDNVPQKGIWVWVDLPAMARAVGIANPVPVMIYEDRVIDSDTYPIGGQVPLPLTNRHQQYAVTWFCLALVCLGVWLAASCPRHPPAD